jgi:energy-coupling factor transport system ATP-binding protein
MVLPAPAFIPFICALILIFSNTSSMLPHSLSQGQRQRQRLAVASILSMEPDIIVLDEPTTGQDWGHLNKFLAQMKMLNEAGKTIILISHDMGVVAEYASRTIVMKDGGILMDAGTREVSTSNQGVI